MNNTAATTTAKGLVPGMVVTVSGSTTPHTVERVWWEEPKNGALRGRWNVVFANGLRMHPSPNTKFKVAR